MIRSKAVLEIKIGDNLYSMECPSQAQLGEVHDALVQMRSIVIGMMQSHVDQDQRAKDEPQE